MYAKNQIFMLITSWDIEEESFKGVHYSEHF